MVKAIQRRAVAKAAAGVALGFAATRVVAALVSSARRVFANRVVVISGGSRGLGLALAEAFGAAGAKLVLIGRDAETLASARALLHERLGEQLDVALVAADVSDGTQIARAAREAVEAYGAVDVLVNNAGIIQVGPFETMTESDFDESIALHVYAPLRLTRALLPALRLSDCARVVNVSSIGGVVSVPHLVPYATGKFGLVGLSEGLAAELRKDGIRVTTACPGLMRTGSPRHALFKSQHEAEYAWFKIADSLPLLSLDVRRAARRIVAACARGAAHVNVSWMSRLAEIAHALVPNAFVDVLALANRMLPSPGGVGSERREGLESETRATRSVFAATTDRAAQRWNQ
jgi:NAD(P)-dependent dehydrogenase (short-subunit alcohol dehydrogenase family)